MANNNLSEKAQMGITVTVAYGYNRVHGNNILLYEQSNKNRIAFFILGEGEWDGIEHLWINSKLVNQGDSSLVHFHPGIDGVLGAGLSPTSIGGDQGVDSFFANLPANYQRLTFSRKAYIALNVPPDPGAPSANLEVVGDYRCMKVRIFDVNGNQIGYQFSTNGAWQILDLLLRVMIRPEWSPVEAAAAGGDLTADEKARIDFPSLLDSAAWCDFLLSSGSKRFASSIGFPRTTKLQQALAQMQTISQLFVVESNGRIYIRPDKPRNSSFILTKDHVLPGTIKFDKVDLHGVQTRVNANFNDLLPMVQAQIDTSGNSGIVRASGVVTVKTIGSHPFLQGDNVHIFGHTTDTTLNNIFLLTSVPDDHHFVFSQGGADETVGGGNCGTPESRFVQRSTLADHEKFQKAIGQRGLRLTPAFRRLPISIDFGNCTKDQVDRVLFFIKTRNLGLEVDPYHAPWTGKITAFYDAVDAQLRSLAEQIVGDIITVDASVSEKFQGDYEIVQRTSNFPALSGSGQSSNAGAGSGGSSVDVATIDLKLLQYIPGAWTDTVNDNSSVRSSIMRGGLKPIASVDSNGVQRLAGTFKNNPVNCFGIFTAGNPLAQSGTTTTINVSSNVKQFGDGQVSYNSGSVNPGSYGTWDVYADDPTFAGGTVTYQATNGNHTLTAANGRVYFGTITTLSGGGGFGQGGGDGDATPPVH
jgi:hypothetical protein